MVKCVRMTNESRMETWFFKNQETRKLDRYRDNGNTFWMSDQSQGDIWTTLKIRLEISPTLSIFYNLAFKGAARGFFTIF